MGEWLGRVWCKFFHRDLWKTERVIGNVYRKRCLECGNVFLFTLQDAMNHPDL
jgi:hypothetical protein